MQNIQTIQIKENRQTNNQITDNQIDKFFAVFRFSLQCSVEKALIKH